MITTHLALITGASRGIGAAIAKQFAAQQFFVVVNYRSNHQAAQSVISEIKMNGGNATAIQADISDEQQVIRLFSELDQLIKTKQLAFSVLVNNAGILKPQSKLVNFDAQRINQVMQTNITGTLLCCREAVNRMALSKSGQGGSIVNISSAASRTGSPFEYIDYAASKGAIDTLTIGLAKEVANEGIRVNAVRPGLIETEIHASGGDPDRIAKLKHKIPMGRGGEVDEVANAAVWLASEQASFTTGSLLDVSGGL